MAHSRRGETIFRRRPEEPDSFFSDLESLPPGTPPADPRRSNATPSVQSGRAAMMFDTEPGQAEQAYSRAAAEPEPGYVPPKKLGFWRSLAAVGLGAAAGRGADVVSRNVFEIPEERAREDYSRRVGAHRRRIGGLKEGADLEANRRTARNTAMFRTTDLNLKFARGAREESLLPRRMKLIESQIGKEEASAGAQKALAEQRRRPSAGRSPFATYSPGQGTYSRETGKVLTPADPAAARAAKPTPRSGVTPTQLATVERDKATKLLAHKKERDKRALQIDANYVGDRGIKPTLPDGSPNPMYTRNVDVAELDRWDRQQKQLIQRSYEEQLKRFGQTVEPFDYGEEEGDLPVDQTVDQSIDQGFDQADAMSADSMDAGDQMDEEDEDAPEIPVGTTYRNPSTGERIQWDGTKWVPVR